MEEFKEKFIEEASELLDSLEQALLKLETDTENKELVNEIFRVMHSLKGTGSMFGFDKLSEFAHNLESIYALVRDDKMKVTKSLIDSTFDSVNVLKELVKEEDEQNVEVKEKKEKILADLKRLTDDKPKMEPDFTEIKSTQRSSFATWYIRFAPDQDILKNGTNPLYMIDELGELGEMKVWLNSDPIPPLTSLNPVLCYVSWDIILYTDKGEEEIEDIFLFVMEEGAVIIEKLMEEDVFHSGLIERLEHELGDRPFDIHLFKALMDHDVKPEKEKVEEKVKEFKEQPVKVQEKKGEITFKETNKMLQTIRVPSHKLDKLMDLVSEVITTQARLEHYSETNPHPELANITEAYQKLSRQLRENVLEMRLIPLTNTVNRFKKLVRDLTNASGKKVEFVTKGTETELDKSIIEKLSDPIIHIIRNSIDHGIELPDERVKAGKPETGTIVFEAYYESSNIVIKISDDGKGIDLQKVKQKAMEKGILKNPELDDKEVVNLIFHPGFSTAEKVTDISGRGVGMDVVKKNIEALRGEIEVESMFGKGTVVKIILPLTLSIIDGLLTYINDNRYIIQIEHILHIYKVVPEEFEDNFDHLIVKDGRQIPYIDLTEKFSEQGERRTPTSMVVLNHEEHEVGILVNKIEGKYQAVIKPLNNRIQTLEVFSGASILGDGNIALVIDSNKLINKLYNKNG